MVLLLQANKVAAEDRVPLFLSIICGSMYTLLRDLLAPELPQEVPYDRLADKLNRHYEPKPVVIAEQFHFHQKLSLSRNLLLNSLLNKTPGGSLQLSSIFGGSSQG